MLVIVTLRDVFEAVVVPRAIGRAPRLSRYLVRGLWRLWPRIAYRLYRDDDAREDFLAIFAPFALICQLLGWIVVLILGYGLIFYSVRDELHPNPAGFGDALYYAGTSLFTMRYGDVTQHGTIARIASVAAAMSGLGLVAVVIAFLFAIFASFQRRETFVVTVGARAGAPPSGVGLLAVHGHARMNDDLPAVFREGQTWAAEVMESHLAYPILVMFRSSHDYESWVATLGTLLDAAVLTITTLDGAPTGQAQIMYEVGRHLTHDFSHYYDFRSQPTVGVERSEFEAACNRLIEAGYGIGDRDAAWERFSQLRLSYAANLNAIARWLEIPPIQWVGDRSLISAQHIRGQMT